MTGPPVCNSVFSVGMPAMHDASRRLQDCLAEMYEPDWFGKEEVDTLAEVRPGNLSIHSETISDFLLFLLSASVSFCYFLS